MPFPNSWPPIASLNISSKKHLNSEEPIMSLSVLDISGWVFYILALRSKRYLCYEISPRFHALFL